MESRNASRVGEIGGTGNAESSDSRACTLESSSTDFFPCDACHGCGDVCGYECMLTPILPFQQFLSVRQLLFEASKDPITAIDWLIYNVPSAKALPQGRLLACGPQEGI